MATVTIKNIDRLQQRLNKIANIELKKAMIDATKLVHAQAKELAPVDTGNLAGSIHQEVKIKGENLEGRVFTNVEYAPYVEFGTGIKGNGSYPYKINGLNLAYKEDWVGMVAQPYMYPALKQNENYIRNLFKSDVKTNLTKTCKGGR